MWGMAGWGWVGGEGGSLAWGTLPDSGSGGKAVGAGGASGCTWHPEELSSLTVLGDRCC